MMTANRNEIAKQYYPLVCKIALQISKSTGYDVNECRSAGNMGLIWAMDSYDPKKQEGKKKQSFMQYAAYMIRGYILNDITQHGHTIRVNSNQQKKLREKGEAVNLTHSLDTTLNDDNKLSLSNIVVGDTEDDIYAAIDASMGVSTSKIWSEVFNILSKNFSERDMDIFYRTFAVNGYEDVSCKRMSEKYNLSAGAITQIRNKIIKYMRENKSLRNKLTTIIQLNSGEGYAE